MSAFLQGLEGKARLRVDAPMSIGVWGAKAILRLAPAIGQTRGEWRAWLICGYDRGNSECRSSERTRRYSKAHILRKSSASRIREKVSQARKASAVIISARKRRPYFQAHTVTVLTYQPLRQVLQNRIEELKERSIVEAKEAASVLIETSFLKRTTFSQCHSWVNSSEPSQWI